MNPEFADAFLVSGLYTLVEYQGMTAEAAFDQLAVTAALPEFQAMIREFAATADGRALLRDTIRFWAREGLPCPWDNLLEFV